LLYNNSTIGFDKVSSMTDNEDFFRNAIAKIVSDTNVTERLVLTATNMLIYLDHKFAKQKTHVIENIELDSFRVDISIDKRSSSKFTVCVYENSFLRAQIEDINDTPKKFYRAVSTSTKSLVIELINLLHLKRYDKRSNSFETILGTAEVEFLNSCLPEGTLDYLKCSVCLDYYNNHSDIFSCSHTLCLPCQQKFVRGRLSCPLCRAKFVGLPQEEDDEEDEDEDEDDSSSEESYDHEEEEDIAIVNFLYLVDDAEETEDNTTLVSPVLGENVVNSSSNEDQNN